ncbi:hypothetical protein [Paracoccus sanguinis]|uniref:Uncharacterized protein n=1 Tax=Paracoccus sanguinis TaxID=1545044 RepID=A0A1H2TNT9_9RHOB|nr:hypothetical protein [Paracoccus sanguinis]SDW45457.1 hypothetical protein SAMN05444276_1011019 [Paracoccus sanguinis]
MADQKPNSTPDQKPNQKPDQQPELTRDTDAYLHDHDTPSHGGRAGGTMAQAIGSEDEHKRADEPDAGTTRVRKADEHRIGTSNLGTENR